MSAITLGPFSVGLDGALLPRHAGRRTALRFDWRGRACEAEIGDRAVTMAAVAARIPSTAEPGADRDRAFATVAALPPELPAGWRLSLLPDHRIRVEAAADLTGAPTATRIIAAMVRFALALDPYLDALEAGGAGVPGRLNNCPG